MAHEDKVRRWGQLATITALTTYGLIVFGGIVRITESGMGCGDDWPLCSGELVPAMSFATSIEYGHRLVAAVVSVLVVALGALTLVGKDRSRPPWPRLRLLGLAAVALLVVQVMLGAVTVWLELPPTTVVLHMGTALLLLAALIVGALEARAASASRWPRRRDRAQKIGWWSAVFAFVVLLAGALVANLDAGPACQGFPLCNGQLIPPGDNPLVHIHWGHRVLAYGFLVWAVALPYLMLRNRPGDRGVSGCAWAAAGLVVAQVALAAAMVLTALPSALRIVHVGLGAAIVAVLVALAWLAAHPRATEAAATG